MGLPWIRLDTSLPDHPKILGLLTERDGHRCAFVYVCCLAFAGRHATDGFIPREALTRVNGRTGDMARLVDAGLLTANAGGWAIHGWAEFQVADDASRLRRERAQLASATRWSRSEANGQPMLKHDAKHDAQA